MWRLPYPEVGQLSGTSGWLAKPASTSVSGVRSADIRASHAGMVAGGTGITPMWQTANQILSDDQDKTTLSLIYANVSFDDILIKDLLDHLAARYPSRWAQ